ncbi:hypothetical protein NDU88_000136 [Pleurodeles waltl]|uniref:Uncharacterized protein n=1 Tax=Pleurodeles waltl TaxID=8319 RepID=A0AAV7MJZ9_PLEWA|nr:hypothetical protein NDU88_000135 [Pleurodeles waltl]KAJ1102692.1 hypothetical protein NDU88_000136 [Pleurodeles waltl]
MSALLQSMRSQQLCTGKALFNDVCPGPEQEVSAAVHREGPSNDVCPAPEHQVSAAVHREVPSNDGCPAPEHELSAAVHREGPLTMSALVQSTRSQQLCTGKAR